MKKEKPLGKKSYGSIPHITGSKRDRTDKGLSPGQVKILTEKVRDEYDVIIVQEKLDGGNVGVCKVNGELIAISRSGWRADQSEFETHHIFAKWVEQERVRFDEMLNEGDRVCGEWLYHAVGIKYVLDHEPFVMFDIFRGNKRSGYPVVISCATAYDFTIPATIAVGNYSSSLEKIKREKSYHGGEMIEGYVWRCERNGKLDFMGKWVDPNHNTGQYLNQNIVNVNADKFLKIH